MENLRFDYTEGYSITQVSTKTGYTFEGWYDKAELTGEAVTEIEADSAKGNVKLYPMFMSTTQLNDNEATTVAIWGCKGVIYVDNAVSDIYVYDLLGRLVEIVTPTADCTAIPVEANRSYIVKCGNVSKKVVIK